MPLKIDEINEKKNEPNIKNAPIMVAFKIYAIKSFIDCQI